LPGFRSFLVALLALPIASHAATRIQAAPVPPEMKSTTFTVTVNGQPVDVAHAASYDWVSFDTTGPVDIAITAAETGFWDHGVDIQPWRLGIRPTRLEGPEGSKTIRFHLASPAKLSISRPGDFLNHAAMLFLFAGTPPPPPPPAGPKVTIIPAGIHRESLNPKTGDTIYLAPGSYIFGSLNLFNVGGVRILGRGTIVYEGTQDPNTDEGWMQKPDWHCIGSINARNVQIDGLTCIVRARTWSIQMKDSFDFTFDDLRVIGGNPGNANQDGMDWLGGGDTIVRDAFIRASDDDLAMEGNWAPAGRARSSTPATLPCATPTFSTPALARAARPSACSACGALKKPKATTPTTPLKISSSTIGTHSSRCNSTRTQPCPDFTDSPFAISGPLTSPRSPIPPSPATSPASPSTT
jgi:hypothetical protein